MSKQDKMIMKQREAENAAGVIIEEAKAKVRRKRGELSDEHKALAPAIQEARTAGVAWWRLAYDLGLPGSAESVSKGKAGAALARRIYAATFGAEPAKPPSQRTARKRSEKNEHVKTIKAESKAERIEKVRTGESVLPADLPDEEVIAMLKGREIIWTINLNDMDGLGDSYSDDSAIIHHRFIKLETHGGERCIAFRELDPKARDARMSPGPIRVVRLSRIHSVR